MAKCKQTKREQARARQQAHGALTPQQRLEKLDRHGHQAIRERLRLYEAIAGVRW